MQAGRKHEGTNWTKDKTNLETPSLLLSRPRSAPAFEALCSPACSHTGPFTTPSCPPPRPAPPAACTRGSITPASCCLLKLQSWRFEQPHSKNRLCLESLDTPVQERKNFNLVCIQIFHPVICIQIFHSVVLNSSNVVLNSST